MCAIVLVSGDSGTAQPHGSRMAENVRAILPQLHQEHSEQHGLEVAAMAQYDLHLERSILLITLVGEVSAAENFTSVSLRQ